MYIYICTYIYIYLYIYIYIHIHIHINLHIHIHVHVYLGYNMQKTQVPSRMQQWGKPNAISWDDDGSPGAHGIPWLFKSLSRSMDRPQFALDDIAILEDSHHRDSHVTWPVTNEKHGTSKQYTDMLVNWLASWVGFSWVMRLLLQAR